MQFEEDNVRAGDEDPEFTGAALSDDDTDVDDEFLADDLAVDDDLLADEEDDDESDIPVADL